MQDSFLLYHVPFNPTMAPNMYHSSSLSLQVFNVSTYSSTNCCLTCSLLINSQQSICSCSIPACIVYHVSFNPIMAPNIHHSSSLSLQVFDVLTYSSANCCLTCSLLINYQQSICSCRNPASCIMFTSIPSLLPTFITHLA
jgi:hypothetical protein